MIAARIIVEWVTVIDRWSRACSSTRRIRSSIGSPPCGGAAGSRSHELAAGGSGHEVVKSGAKEITDCCRYFRGMRLQRKVSGVEEADDCRGDVALERSRAHRQEEWVVFCPTPPETAACKFGSTPERSDRARRCSCSRRTDPTGSHRHRDGPGRNCQANSRLKTPRPDRARRACIARTVVSEARKERSASRFAGEGSSQ
jgi:hypothetical protein